MKKKSFIDKLIYKITKKPECYKRVKNPPKSTLQKLLNPQAARQQQYNEWSTRFGVYSGSYLPKNPNALKKKGWEETTSTKNKTGDYRDFQRKSTKQMIRYDEKTFKKGRWEDEHYHWDNAKSVEERRKLQKQEKYLDRYGNPCAYKSPESHLAPLDQDYNHRR